MPEGKYFFIRSKLNDLVLDLQDGSRDPGTRVVTWYQKPDENDSQLWHEDHLTGTIRNREIEELCLDIDDEGFLIVNEFCATKTSQQWLVAGDRLQNRTDSSQVLQVTDSEPPEGATVTTGQANGGDQQKWIFEYNPARFFYIRSKLHDKVVDIKDVDSRPDPKVIVRSKASPVADSQLWYEDKHGIICSKLNGYVLDSGEDGKIRLAPYEAGNKSQLWTVQSDRIVNRVEPTLVLDIKGSNKQDGTRLISYPWRDQPNQKWHLDYI